LVIPACFALAMLFLANPAGDWLDDSALLLVGLPALGSALVIFVMCQRRVPRVLVSAAWAAGSGVAAAFWFGVFLMLVISIGCAEDGC
jgi:hypothetical protein